MRIVCVFFHYTNEITEKLQKKRTENIITNVKEKQEIKEFISDFNFYVKI